MNWASMRRTSPKFRPWAQLRLRAPVCAQALEKRTFMRPGRCPVVPPVEFCFSRCYPADARPRGQMRLAVRVPLGFEAQAPGALRRVACTPSNAGSCCFS